MRTDYIDPATLRLLVNRMSAHTALPVLFSLETGLRIGDVVSLPLEALKGTKVYYTAHKTGKSGQASISPKLFNDVLKHANGKWLFPSPRDPEQHITRQAVWKALKKQAKDNDIQRNIAPHTARKAFAVDLMKKAGVGEVQKRLQHSDLATTLLYCLSDPDFTGQGETRDVLRTLTAKVDGLCERIELLIDTIQGF